MTGPIILIGAGVLFLLNNLGILPWSIWGGLWRLWPLILIAVGLDLVLGRRRPVVSLLITLVVLGIGGAIILYAGVATRGDLAAYKVNLPLTAAKSANVRIDFGMGELHVDGGGGSESLATVSLEYYANRHAPEATVDLNGERADLVIHTPDEDGFNFDWFGSSRSPRWDIHLSPKVPTSLEADLGVGETTLDLSGVYLTNLDVNAGTGNTTTIFPKPTESVTAKVDGGVGNLTLRIPDGVEAKVSIDTGVGNSSVDNRFIKQSDKVWTTSGYNTATNKLDLTIDAGVGNVEVTP